MPRIVDNETFPTTYFTVRAKRVLELSVDEDRNLNHSSVGHSYVGTEHLLLGILREHEGVAAKVLESYGLELDDVRRKVLEVLNKN